MIPLAHSGEPIAPHDLWGAWALDPAVLVLVGVTVLIYARTVRRRWRRHGHGAVISSGQVAAFAAGITALLVALISPLDALGASLFSAHMGQHLLLTMVAAPLLSIGRVDRGLLPIVPLSWRRRGGRRVAAIGRRADVAGVVAAVGFHVAVVLAWHLPLLYDAAIRLAAVHALEHVSFLVGGILFWVAMGAARPQPVAAAGLAAFVASLASILLGAVMTVATEPWFVSHLATTRTWGLTPLEDQQLAAAIMWVPGGIVYLGAAAFAIFRWIRADERLAAPRTFEARAGR